jgi:hypothetical protein
MPVKGDHHREGIMQSRIGDGLPDDLLMAQVNSVKNADRQADLAVAVAKFTGGVNKSHALSIANLNPDTGINKESSSRPLPTGRILTLSREKPSVHPVVVPQTSKSAVSRVSKPACLPPLKRPLISARCRSGHRRSSHHQF